MKLESKDSSANNHLPKPEHDEHNYPSDLVDPKIKNTKEYILKYMKCFYYQYYNNRSYVTSDIRNQWINQRKYADGNQGNRKYVTKLSKLQDAQNEPVSYMDLDQRPLKIIPKYLDIVTSYLDKIDYDIYCDSIHPEAHLAREEHKWNMLARMDMQDFFADLEKQTGVELAEKEQLPKTKQELELMMQYGFRLNEEMQMELGQQMVLYENDWKEVRKQLTLDVVRHGVMFASVEIDRISGRIKVNYEDPINAILEDFRGHKGTMQRRGVFRKMTIAQAMLRWGSQFTREEYFQMAKSCTGKYGNPENIGEFGDYVNTDAQYDSNRAFWNWENNIIYVMDAEWDSCDRLKFERYENLHGNTMVFRREFSQPIGKKTYVGEGGLMYEREVYATDIKTIYGGELVLGTDYIANWGKKANIPRPNENPKEAHGKFLFYRVANTSILDRMLPYIDAMQLIWMKIQNLAARAIPKGFIIKQDALMDVVIDSKIQSQQQLMEMLFQTGILVVNDKTTLDDDSPNTSTRPITETEGGIGGELQEQLALMLQCRQSLQEDTGINQFMDASTPNPNALVGVANIAVTGAQNAIYPCFAGFITMHEMICSSITLNVQLITRLKGSFSGYAPSLGETGTKFVSISSTVDRTVFNTPVMYGHRIQARATHEQKERILAYIDAAISNSQNPGGGGIDVTDGIELSRMINAGVNLKLVVAIIGERMKKHKEFVHSKDMEKIKEQNEGAAKAAKAAEEEKRKTAKFELDLAKELETHKADQKIRIIQAEYVKRGENDVIKGEVKKDVEKEKELAKVEQ